MKLEIGLNLADIRGTFFLHVPREWFIHTWFRTVYLSIFGFRQKRSCCFHQATASRHEVEIFTHRERIRILPHNSKPIHIINMHSLHPYHRRALPTTYAGQEQHAIGTHQASSPSHGTRFGTWWAHMAAALGPGVCCRGVHTVVARRCWRLRRRHAGLGSRPGPKIDTRKSPVPLLCT